MKYIINFFLFFNNSFKIILMLHRIIAYIIIVKIMKMNTVLSKFRQEFRAEIKKIGFTEDQLRQAIGKKNQSTISRFLNGKYKDKQTIGWYTSFFKFMKKEIRGKNKILSQLENKFLNILDKAIENTNKNDI